MSKTLYASTTITINFGASEAVDFVSVNETASLSDKKTYLVTSHDNTKLEFKEYECRVSKRTDTTEEAIEVLSITDGTASLKEIPSKIIDVTFAMRSAGFPTNSTLNGKDLLFGAADGEVAIIQVTYEYKAVEIEVMHQGTSSSFVTLGTAGSIYPDYKAILKTTCELASTFTEISYVNEKPDLSESHETTSVLTMFSLYSTSRSSLSFLKDTFTGGMLIGSVYEVESITETISIEAGYGFTSKNIMGLESYEFLSGYGSLTVDYELNKDNRLKFIGTGSYSGVKEAVVNVTYQTNKKVYTYGSTEESAFYKFEDQVGNSVSGTIDVTFDELEDVEIFVEDYDTGDPVFNAGVEIAGKKAVTDSNGRAVFFKMPKGKYLVKISKSGYISNLKDDLINEWLNV